MILTLLVVFMTLRQKYWGLFTFSSSSQAVKAGNPNSVLWHLACCICLCKAHVLWMKWFVFLITASPPFPVWHSDKHTPSGICSFHPLLPCFFESLLSVVLIFPGSLYCPSSCPCFYPSFLLSSPLIPHLTLFSILMPTSRMPAGVPVLRSKYCHGNGSQQWEWLQSQMAETDSLWGILKYNSVTKRVWQEHNNGRATYRYCPHYAKVKYWAYRSLLLICVHVAFQFLV